MMLFVAYWDQFSLYLLSLENANYRKYILPEYCPTRNTLSIQAFKIFWVKTEKTCIASLAKYTG